MLLPVIYLGVSLYVYRPTAVLISALVYLVLLGLSLIDVLWGRKAKDYAQAAVLRELFSQIHGELFADDEYIRITLFRPSPSDREYIVPWYRYTANTEDPISEAQKSLAKYRRGEGFTGQAWMVAGEEIIIASFPEFFDRNEFEAYYIDTLGIDPKTVKSISVQMVNVRTVLTYGFNGIDGELLGVLSVDLHLPLEVVENKYPRIGATDIRADTLIQLLDSIESTLEAFAKIEKRAK
jgi:hypothetical protein